jgi:3'-5' exoribonuclease
MKAVFTNAIVPNETITTQFLVTYKEIRQKKTGDPYLTLLLADRTGEIEAKMWDNVAEVMSTFDRDDFVKVKGLAQIYQNRQQFTIHKLRRLEDHEVEPSDYFPCSSRNPDEMFSELMGVIESIQNPHLKALLNQIFSDQDLAFLYRKAPAAKSVHHACLGGLIEHVLSLCVLCRMAAAHYKDLDLDLLLAAAILHDIGKVQELSYSRSFGYSTAGQLLGHIVIGLQLIHSTIQRLPDFPPKLGLLLDHIVLSHHGELEFGSPKMPAFPEALLFHHLDNLDSKFEAMRFAIERDHHVLGDFTGWIPALERIVLKKERFLNPPPTPSVSLAPPAANEERSASHPPPPVSPYPVTQPPTRPAPTTPFGEKLRAVLNAGERQS